MEVQTETYLTKVPHEGGFLSFRFPAFKGAFAQVVEQIDKAGLVRPTSAQTASLIYGVLCNPEGDFEPKIFDPPMGYGTKLEFTGNLFLPINKGKEVHGGILVEDNPQIKDGQIIMDESKLIQRLKENDSSVRFVPYGYKIGLQSIEDLRKNQYIIAQYGEEGANKLAEFASKSKHPPFINQHSLNYQGKKQVRSNAINPFHSEEGPHLSGGFQIYSHPNHPSIGHAFGVKRQG